MQDTNRALVPSIESPGLPAASIDELDRRADEFDRNSLAKNTRRSYRSDWVSWLTFCERHRIKPIPAEPVDVRRYLTQLGASEGARAPSSSRRRRSGISPRSRRCIVGQVSRSMHSIPS